MAELVRLVSEDAGGVTFILEGLINYAKKMESGN